MVTHGEKLLSSGTFNAFKIPLMQGQPPALETKSEGDRKDKCDSIPDCLEMETKSSFSLLQSSTSEERQGRRY